MKITSELLDPDAAAAAAEKQGFAATVDRTGQMAVADVADEG